MKLGDGKKGQHPFEGRLANAGPTESAAAPGEPPAMRLQPRPGVFEVTSVEAEVNCQALQEEPFLVDVVAGLRGDSLRKECKDLLPGDFRFATVSAQHAECTRDLSPEVCVPKRRQIIQDVQRINPLSVENETRELGQAR